MGDCIDSLKIICHPSRLIPEFGAEDLLISLTKVVAEEYRFSAIAFQECDSQDWPLINRQFGSRIPGAGLEARRFDGGRFLTSSTSQVQPHEAGVQQRTILSNSKTMTLRSSERRQLDFPPLKIKVFLREFAKWSAAKTILTSSCK